MRARRDPGEKVWRRCSGRGHGLVTWLCHRVRGHEGPCQPSASVIDARLRELHELVLKHCEGLRPGTHAYTRACEIKGFVAALISKLEGREAS